MWKAIVWGFAGLLLGVVLGGPMGAALGAVMGTLIGSVAGALHFHRHRSATVCEPQRSGPSLLQVAGVVTGAAVGVAVLKVALPLVEAVTLTVFAACAVSVVVLIRVLTPTRRPVRSHYVERITNRAAIPAPRRALEQPRQVVHVITDARERISR